MTGDEFEIRLLGEAPAVSLLLLLSVVPADRCSEKASGIKIAFNEDGDFSYLCPIIQFHPSQ